MPIQQPRPLRAHEVLLLRYLGSEEHLLELGGLRVQDVEDGGMGTIDFVGDAGGEMKLVASCQFLDTDGLQVVVDLLLWTDGRPASLEFWKVDDSGVKEFPRRPSELSPVKYANTH